MVSGDFEPMIWDRVDLHLGNHGTIECAVRWIRDGRVGLEFAHETHLDWPSEQVAIVLRHVIEHSFPHISLPEPKPAASPAPPPEPINEERRAPRHPLIWKATLHHNYQSDTVRIRNISSSGAMIETGATVIVGTEPLLEFSEAVSISATVEWAVGDQVGLRFHLPFDMNVLAEIRPTVATQHWERPEYLDPNRQQDERLSRLSLPELLEELEGFLKR